MSALIPFGRNEHNLFSYLDDMEKSLFGDMGAGFGQVRTDIVDRGDHYLLQAELPGFDKKDLHIDIQGDELCISATHDEKSEEKDDQGRFVRRERRYGSYRRSFDISDIDTAAIDASYQNGILELKLPKKAPVADVRHQIEIK